MSGELTYVTKIATLLRKYAGHLPLQGPVVLDVETTGDGILRVVAAIGRDVSRSGTPRQVYEWLVQQMKGLPALPDVEQRAAHVFSKFAERYASRICDRLPPAYRHGRVPCRLRLTDGSPPVPIEYCGTYEGGKIVEEGRPYSFDQLELTLFFNEVCRESPSTLLE